MRDHSDGGMKMTPADLAGRMSDLKLAGGSLSDEERVSFRDSFLDLGQPVDFELFLRVHPLIPTFFLALSTSKPTV